MLGLLRCSILKFQSILSVLKEFALLITYPKWLGLTGTEYVIDLTHQCASNHIGLKILSSNLKITSFAEFHVGNSSNLSQRCYKCFRKLRIAQRIQNYSTHSELLNVFRITATYSELLNVFRITQHIHFLRGRAERRARNVSHLDRPWASSVAYHALDT